MKAQVLKIKLETMSDNVASVATTRTDSETVDALVNLERFAETLADKIEALKETFRLAADKETTSETVRFAGSLGAVVVGIAGEGLAFKANDKVESVIGAHRFRKIAPRKISATLARKELNASELRKVASIKLARRSVKLAAL